MKLVSSYIIIGLFLIGSAYAEEISTLSNLPYPVDYCLISGEKLGSMEGPVKIEYESREIQICFGYCVETFQNKPYFAEQGLSAEQLLLHD